MTDNKRYFWLKLNEKFFEDDTVTWLEEQENGKEYVIFYLKLCLKSLQDNGNLIRYVGEKLIPYDAQALSKLTHTKIDTVVIAMKLFIDIGLVSRLETGEIYLNQINELIGSETEVAKRVRKHRSKDILLQCNTAVTKCNTEKEKDIEKDIEIERKPARHKYGIYDNVLLSDSDTQKLINEFPNDYQERIERLSEYMASTGKPYKNHLATMRNWAKRDKTEGNPFKEALRKELENEQSGSNSNHDGYQGGLSKLLSGTSGD